MVMPCSRSARRPSTSSDRSGVDRPLSTDALHGLDLVGEHRLGVVEQPPDERGLAVVDAARRRETQEIACHQK
jgi:hypothetical protein